MAQLNFGGVIENVMTREEFPLEKAREILRMRQSQLSVTVYRVPARLATCATMASTLS